MKRTLVLAAFLTLVPLAAHAEQPCVPACVSPAFCRHGFCWEKLPSDDCKLELMEDVPTKLRLSFQECPGDAATGGGVAVHLVPAHGFGWDIGTFNTQVSVQPALGSYQRFRAYGSRFPGDPSALIASGTVTLTSLGRELTSDFAPIGAATFRVEVMNGTALALAANGRSGVGARAGAFPMSASFDARPHPVVIIWKYASPITIQVPGVGAVTGDQVRFVAESTQQVAWFDRTETSTVGFHDIALGPFITAEVPAAGTTAAAAAAALLLAAGVVTLRRRGAATSS